MSRPTKNPKAAKGNSPRESRSRGRSLSQRAKSFKEDLLEFISHMRSPRASRGLPESPSTPVLKDKTSDTIEPKEERNLSKDLEYNLRQARFALSHFRSVIKKNQLEMLPGNGTVVLETVTAIQTLLNKHAIIEFRYRPSNLVLAGKQVHESVAKLLKFCDDYLLIGQEVLVQENIADIVAEVGFNIEKWVALIKDELGIQDRSESDVGELSTFRASHKPRTLFERSSLGAKQSSPTYIPHSFSDWETPDNTTVVVIEKQPETSAETPEDTSEYVLRESPPPKPPLPDRVNLNKVMPPPLPPKKRHSVSTVKSTSDRSCVRSKSPEGSASLLPTFAGNLDSAPNQQKVDEDVMEVLAEPPHEFNQVDEEVTAMLSGQDDRRPTFYCDNSGVVPAEKMGLIVSSGGVSDVTAMLSGQDDRRPTFYCDNSGVVPAEKMGLIVSSGGVSDVTDSPALGPDNSLAKLMDRLSGSQAESGFGSIPSRRSSSQSYSASSPHLSSTRSSQQSYSSQESYQTEKRVLSPDASISGKVPSVAWENDPTVLSASSSFEKLSLQKQTYSKRTTELLSSEYSSSTNTTNTQSVIVQVSHGEMKIEESYLRSPSPSSPSSQVPLPISSHYCFPSLGIQLSPDDDTPPALPEKTRARNIMRRRQASQYDPGRKTFQTNEDSESTFILSHIQTEEGDSIMIQEQKISTKFTFAVEDSSVAGAAQSDTGDDSVAESHFFRESKDQAVQTDRPQLPSSLSSESLDLTPPPLPPKKRPIMAYMEMFGNASREEYSDEFLRHSVHAYKKLQNEWQEQQRLLSSSSSCCFNSPTDSNPSTPIRKAVAKSSKTSAPPALPPKKTRGRASTSVASTTPALRDDDSAEWKTTLSKEEEVTAFSVAHITREQVPGETTSYLEIPLSGDHEESLKKDSLEVPLVESLDVAPHIQYKKVARGVFVVKGGSVEALIAHAANSHETDYMYEEAFIITYRTFITPFELFQKLVNRYDKLCGSPNEDQQKASKDTFDFIVRTADSLTLLDLDHDLLRTLMGLVHRMVRRGDLSMGTSLRNILIQRCELKKFYNSIKSVVTPSSPCTRTSLFDFKSEQIAEQMTMMDAELFLRIESPEILTWAEDQREELSPNLSRFTVHFNKMSYWTRSRILEQRDARSRERYLLKFIKIMKHLRKINNFNSCLALLSALDSAPVRRLDWQKHVLEGIQEHSDLIDSSSSFRAYRLALADSQPPCIPYIGLVLQDLTFINAGNPNLLPDGSINFSKRWQQYDVIQNMARFKIGLYNYRKNEKIIKFFNDFDDALSEEEMWQLSERLKPRPSKGS